MHNKQKLHLNTEELPSAHTILEIVVPPGAPRVHSHTEGVGNPWITHKTEIGIAPSVSLSLHGLRAILCESKSQYTSISTNVLDFGLWWAASSDNLVAYVPKHTYATRFFFPVQPTAADLGSIPLWLSPGEWLFVYEDFIGVPQFGAYETPDFYPPITILTKPALSQPAITDWNSVYQRQTSYAYFGHELGLT